MAILWTLLIFIVCFLPAREIPEVDVPLADKWVHFILFGTYAFLWLLSVKQPSTKSWIVVFISAVLVGWLVEVLQGALSFLGRSQDNMDIVADAIGGFLGVAVFALIIRQKGKPR